MSYPGIEVTWEANETRMSELEQAKAKLRWTEENLRALSEGVRLIASHLMTGEQQQHNSHARRKSTDSDDNATHATAEESILSEDGGAIHEVLPIKNSFSLEHDELSDILAMDRMAPMPASDLLALQNASKMVMEHSRLSSNEVCTAVEDTIQAQAAARELQRRASKAESELKRV